MQLAPYRSAVLRSLIPLDKAFWMTLILSASEGKSAALKLFTRLMHPSPCADAERPCLPNGRIGKPGAMEVSVETHSDVHIGGEFSWFAGARVDHNIGGFSNTYETVSERFTSLCNDGPETDLHPSLTAQVRAGRATFTSASSQSESKSLPYYIHVLVNF